VAAPQDDEDFGAWELMVSARTDMEGWEYGSVFKCATVVWQTGHERTDKQLCLL